MHTRLPGRRPRRRLELAIICCGCIFGVATGAAQAQDSVLVVTVGDARTGEAIERLRDGGLASGVTLTDDPAAWAAHAETGFAPQRLGALVELDRLLAQAQAQAAALDEGAALSSLAQASRAGADLLDLPGIAAWHAEIEMRTGLVAAQAGRPQLADAALRRAASLDLERRLMAAEATPEVVKLAQTIWQQARSAAEGRVRVDTDVPGAQVFLDDVLVGTAPLTVAARVGRHVLRVEAPGSLAYGTFLELMAGERPPIGIALPPDPAVERAQAVLAAAHSGHLQGIETALAAMPERAAAGGPRQVWVVQLGRRAERMLLSRCQRGGCEPAMALEGAGARPQGGAPGQPGQLPLGSVAAARWLDEPARAPAARPSSDRLPGWVIWGSAIVATAATATLTALLSDGRTEPRRELTVVVDPGDAAP